MVDFWNSRCGSNESLQSSETKPTSRAPFFSTTGTLNWFADRPVPSPPGLSGWIAVCDHVVSAGLLVGIVSVYDSCSGQ